MMVGIFRVTMRHDGKKTISIRVNASSVDAAARLVCEYERAPLSALVNAVLIKKLA